MKPQFRSFAAFVVASSSCRGFSGIVEPEYGGERSERCGNDPEELEPGCGRRTQMCDRTDDSKANPGQLQPHEGKVIVTERIPSPRRRHRPVNQPLLRLHGVHGTRDNGGKRSA